MYSIMSKDSVTYFKAYIPPETAFAFRIQRKRKVDKQHEANMPCFALLCPRYGQREEVTQILGFTLGTRRFLDTNLLVLVTQNARFGVMPNAMPNREGVRVQVEYRLKTGRSSSNWSCNSQ